MTLNQAVIRESFPIIASNSDLVYLDNTATTQKPASVIDKMTTFLQEENATVHRGIYGLSQRATVACEQVRSDIKAFINGQMVWTDVR